MDPFSELKIPTLHVSDIELPRELEKLYELAYNLWWTWTSPARALFAAVVVLLATFLLTTIHPFLKPRR